MWTVSDGNGLAYHYGAGTYDNWTNSLDSWSQSSSGLNNGSGLNDGFGLNEPSLSTWQQARVRVPLSSRAGVGGRISRHGLRSGPIASVAVGVEAEPCRVQPGHLRKAIRE